MEIIIIAIIVFIIGVLTGLGFYKFRTRRKKVELTSFVRKPFIVEAVEITTDNIADIAELVGTLRGKGTGQPYIQVDRRLVPNVFKVYPGFWMTKMGDNIRCYSNHIFRSQFVENNDQIKGLLEEIGTEPVKPSENGSD